MKKRPVILLLFPYMIGLIIADQFHFMLPELLIILLTGIFLVVTFLTGRNHPNHLFYLLVLLMCFAGIVRMQMRQKVFSGQTIRYFLDDPIRVRLMGRVIATPEKMTKGMRSVVSVDSIRYLDTSMVANGRILMRWQNEQPQMRIGEQILAAGTLTVADGQRNPGEFNYRNYLRRKNIAGLFYVGRKDSIKIVGPGNRLNLSELIFDRPREKVVNLFERYVRPNENVAFLKGLILGLRGEIDPEIRTDFADAGVVHVLAVSGLHVGFVTLFLLGLSILFRLPFTVRTIFLLTGLFYYAGLTGFKPPVVRAVIMADLFLVGTLIQRKTDVYNILTAAALLILWVNPQALFDVGFQLSFTAVFSILFFYKRFHRIVIPQKLRSGKIHYKILRWPLELILVSLCAQIGTFPFTAIYFDRIPLAAVLANIVAIPLVMLIVLLGFILIPAAIIWMNFAQLIGDSISHLLDVLIDFIHWFSAFHFLKVDVSYLSTFQILFGFIVFMAVVYKVFRRKYGHALIIILILINFQIWRPLFEQKDLRVTFLDVGQGDACVIETPAGKTVLIDTGPKTQNYDAGMQTIIPYLKRRHVDQIEAVFITHAHEDHIGGLNAILRRIPVKKVFSTHFKNHEESYLTLCDSLNIPHRYFLAGDTLNSFLPVAFQILAPLKFMLNDDGFDENENSLVLSVTYGKSRFLFCGDIEQQTENLLIGYQEMLDCDVLKSPHHGSRTSNTLRFLQQTSPEFAVISVGKWNRFGHPSRSVLQRFRDLNIKVSRTDKNGAVIFCSDGEKVWRIR